MKKKYSDPFVAVEPIVKEHPTHYVDNKRFYTEISEYHYAWHAAKEAGTEPPRVSNYLGECVWKIAKGLAQKHNFRNYSYIDEMIAAGVETCIKNMHVFNPTKSQNPFSYFTQACHFTFIHIIQKEKRQADIKRKLVLNSAIDTYALQSQDEDEFTLPLIEYLNSISIEEPKRPEVQPVIKKPGALDSLFGEE
jgi:hypothetical protein